MRVGLIDVLDALEDDNSDELQTQLKVIRKNLVRKIKLTVAPVQVFYEHKEEDFDEFAQRLEFLKTMATF